MFQQRCRVIRLATIEHSGRRVCTEAARDWSHMAIDTTTDTTIRPFHVDFPQQALDDMRRRISATRWPEARDGLRRLSGRVVGTDAGPGALLGDRLRLEQVRGEAERPTELHHRDRWARHPFPSRPLPTRGCPAPDRHARMARLDHRAAEDHRAPHQSDRTRRHCPGRLSPGDPVAARPRLLGKAGHAPAGIRPASPVPGSC